LKRRVQATFIFDAKVNRDAAHTDLANFLATKNVSVQSINDADADTMSGQTCWMLVTDIILNTYAHGEDIRQRLKARMVTAQVTKAIIEIHDCTHDEVMPSDCSTRNYIVDVK
jgi:hypothetical protein